MSRKKQLWCEFCEQELYAIEENGAEGHTLTVEIYPGRMISAISFAPDPYNGQPEECVVEIPMKYCPNCGRKLAET